MSSRRRWRSDRFGSARPGAAIAAVAVFVLAAVVLGWNRLPREDSNVAEAEAVIHETSTPETAPSTTASPSPTSTTSPSTTTEDLITTTTVPMPGIVEMALPDGGTAPVVWLHSLAAVSAADAWAIVAPVEEENAANLIGRVADGVWTAYEVTGSRWGAVGLAAAPDGTIWAATDVGVFAFDGRDWRMRGDDLVGGIAVAGDGTVWIGGRRSGLGGPADPRLWLAHWDGDSWDRVDPVPDALPDDAAGAAIAPASDGGAWIAFRPGYWVEDDLMHYDGSTMQVVDVTGVPDATPDDAMPPVRVFEVEVASDGSVWAVGYLNADPGQGVLARLDAAGWTIPAWPFPALEEGEETMVVVEAAASPDGTMWFAVGRGGLWSFDGTEWREHLGGGSAFNVDVAPDGSVWYADEEGIYVLGSA